MIRVWLILWLLVPLAVVAWHVGPGQRQLSEDRAGVYIRQAQAAADEQRWEDSARAYGQARMLLPDEARGETYRLELEAALAWIRSGDDRRGQQMLEDLLATMQQDAEVDEDLYVAASQELAVASYHAAWLLRLTEAPVDQWRAKARLAVQQFRSLAERAEGRAASATNRRNSTAHRQARIFKRNLEAAVKLQQLDLEQLRARPVPDYLPKLTKPN